MAVILLNYTNEICMITGKEERIIQTVGIKFLRQQIIG